MLLICSKDGAQGPKTLTADLTHQQKTDVLIARKVGLFGGMFWSIFGLITGVKLLFLPA